MKNSDSRRKHGSRSSSRSSVIEGGQTMKSTTCRHTRRARRRRSSVSSTAASDNSAHEKDSTNIAAMPRDGLTDPKTSISGESPVKTMQLVLDKSGTQLSCETTLFSSTHTSTTVSTSQTTTPRSSESIRTTRKRASGMPIPTMSSSSSNSAHRRTVPITTRMRNSLTAQRLAKTRKEKEEAAAKNPTRVLTPKELLHESCIF